MLNPDHSKFNSTLVTPTLHVPCANLPAVSSQTAAQLLRGQPMSSTAVLGFIKDIVSNNLKSVQDRLKATPSQGPNQRFTDPKQQGLSYPLLHKAVEVKSREIVCALIEAGADVNATDSTGRTALCWLASSNSPDESTLATAGAVAFSITLSRTSQRWIRFVNVCKPCLVSLPSSPVVRYASFAGVQTPKSAYN